MATYYLFPFRPLLVSSYGPKLRFPTRWAIGDADVLSASCNSCIRSTCLDRLLEQGGLIAAPRQLFSGQGRAGAPSCSSMDGNDALEYPQVNAISFRCILCFHFQVGFLSFSVGWFVMISHSILFEVVFITSLTHYTNICFSNHSTKCFIDAIEMDTNLMFGLIRINVHQIF